MYIKKTFSGFCTVLSYSISPYLQTECTTLFRRHIFGKGLLFFFFSASILVNKDMEE